MSADKQPRRTPRQLREQTGITQMRAAVALDVSLSTIQGIENRGVIPRVDFAEKLATLYGVTLEGIEWGKAEPGKPGNRKGAPPQRRTTRRCLSRAAGDSSASTGRASVAQREEQEPMPTPKRGTA